MVIDNKLELWKTGHVVFDLLDVTYCTFSQFEEGGGQ